MQAEIPVTAEGLSEEQQNQAVDLFNARLERMLQLRYTQDDIDFCNSERPVYYAAIMLKRTVKKMYGATSYTNADFKYVLSQWKRTPNYIPKYGSFELPSDTSFFSSEFLHNTPVTFLIDARTNFNDPNILAQFLKQAEIHFYMSSSLSVLIDKSCSMDVWLEIPALLSKILSISKRNKINILSPVTPYGLDCTPFIMLTNLFKTQINFNFPNPELKREFHFRQDVIVRLLKLHNMLLVKKDHSEIKSLFKTEFANILIQEFQKKHKNVYLINKDTLAELNTEIGKIKHSTELITLHRKRMDMVVELCTHEDEIAPEVILNYFESVILISRLAGTLKQNLADEIFNHHDVCIGLDVVLQNIPLLLPVLVEVSNNMGHYAFPRHTGWEAMLVGRLTAQIREEDVSTYPAILANLKYLIQDGCFIQMAAELFSHAVTYLQQQNESDFEKNLIPLLKYLVNSKNLTSQFDPSLTKLFVALLSNALHDFPRYGYYLEEYTNILITLEASNVLTTMLQALTTPKQEGCPEHDYYASLALANFICISGNHPSYEHYYQRIAQLASHSQEIFSTYDVSNCLAFIEQLLTRLHKIDVNTVFTMPDYLMAMLAIKFYHYLTNHYQCDGLQENMHKAFTIAIDFIRKKVNPEFPTIQIVNKLPDIYDNTVLVKLWLEFRGENTKYLTQVSDEIFSVLIREKGETESEENHLERTSQAIMLVSKFKLADRLWWHYMSLLKLRGTETTFNEYIQTNPQHYVDALLAVYKQYKVFFPKNYEPEDLLEEILINTAMALQQQKALTDLATKLVRGIFRNINQDTMFRKIFQFPPDVFTSLMQQPNYLSAFLKAICNHKQFHTQLREKLTHIPFDRLIFSKIATKVLSVYSECSLTNEFIGLLLDLGADVYEQDLIGKRCTCSIVRSIAANSSLFHYLLLKNIVNIAKLYMRLPDPLGLAVKAGCDLSTINAMIKAGCKVSLYQKPEKIPNSSREGHIYICEQAQNLLFNESQQSFELNRSFK